ncbi:unnamed protein product [Danaus chrysippus]|uniref:Beta-1,4-N-acetylgalactosaminyltransferase n=1 Tax=Danaus chrysippus TaxID=151541 RepID=A0A8J2RC83_9NEOP|nr:unnamed protein product [Danaus chrysippus]
MPKWFSCQRLLHLQLSTSLFIALVIVAIVQFFACYTTYNYNYLTVENVGSSLYHVTNPKLVINKSKPECKYEDLLLSSKSTAVWDVPKNYDDFLPTGILNGSYFPDDCNPLYSVAILVTYRNRQSQLDIFIPYMHNFLRKQRIHYKIYVIEQQDNKPWNKGILYNIGAKQAIADKFPCLILHDVDLLPLDEANLYACLRQPRHMSASIDKFRYVLIYSNLVGGVLAITSEQYMEVNGFSNKYEGWGGEDDDFANRLRIYDLQIMRFPPTKSRYTMLRHRQEKKNKNRHRIMSNDKSKIRLDGVKSLPYYTASVRDHRLYSMVSVRL